MKALIFALIFTFFPTFLFASGNACGLKLNVSSSQLFFHFDNKEASLDVEVLANQGIDEDYCNDYFIGVTSAQSSLTGAFRLSHVIGREIPIFVFKNSNRFQPIGDVSSSATLDKFINGSLYTGLDSVSEVAKRNDHTIYFQLGENTSPMPAGAYTGLFTVNLYSGSVQSPVWEDSQAVNVGVYFPTLINVSLVEEGAPFNALDVDQRVDFGTLVKGAERRFDLVVESNTSYALSFNSFNDGRLAHQSENHYVDYDFLVDNTSVNFTNKAIQSHYVGNLNEDIYRRHNIRLIIGDVRNKLSGFYSDFITVTATSLE